MKRVSVVLSVMTFMSHFFCCVLPLLSSFTSLGASLGLFAISSPLLEWFVQYEKQVFIIAGILITISALSQYISYRIDCHKTGCEHGECEPKKKWSNKIFMFAVALYAVNLLIFLVLPHAHIH